MNIVLLGYRGTGKSVVSKILSHKLKRQLFSIDNLIVLKAGLPVPEIVEQSGWPRFRELESQVIEQVAADTRDTIIDCGGGVVLNDRNMERLKRHGKVVLLTTDMETLLKRLSRGANRPPLKEGLSFEEEHKKVLAERQDKYQAAADMVCDTSHKRPIDTVQEIVDYFKNKSWI